MTAEEKQKAQDELKALSELLPITLEQGAEELGIKTPCRKNEILFKRQLFWQMLKFRYGKQLTLQRLGIATGGHTHATVLNGINECANEYPKREQYRNEVLEVVKRIKIIE